MKLTTKGRYAVTALLDMALHDNTGPITVSVLAARHGLSPAYLERLAGKLRSSGLIKSIRGAKGGYVLARSAQEITLADIIDAVEEQIDTTLCKGKANCHGGNMCLTHHVWDALNHNISDFFQSITLGSLVQKNTSMPLRITHA